MTSNDSEGAQDPLFATIPRSRGEELRVGLSSLNGHFFLDLRIWYRTEDGTMRPTKKGATCPLQQMPALHEALTKAVAFACQEGLLRP